MKKFRLVFNGNLYRIQYRYLIFFWRFVQGYSMSKTLEFHERESAEEYLESLTKSHAKYRPLKSRRDSPIWKVLHK